MAFDRRETAILAIGDFFILAASLWVALLLRNLAPPSFGYFETLFVPFIPVFFLSLGIFYISGLYEKQTRPIRRIMGVRILGAQAATVAIAAILFFVLPLDIAPKTILVLYLIVSVLAASAWRFHRMRYELKSGKRTPALLVGSGPAVSELYDEVNGNGLYLIRFTAHIGTKDVPPGAVAEAILAGIGSGARAVVIDLSDAAVARDLPRLYSAMSDHVRFIEFPTFYEEIFDRVPLEHLDPGELLDSLPKQGTLYDAGKRIFDTALALVLSIIAIPFVVIAALVLLPGGTPFIHPERIGRGGRIIRMLKLRTMLFFDGGDPEKQKLNRVTKFGAFLRKTRIDELPQLWNVLTGDLSFIGPRPEFPTLAKVYEMEVPQYHLRHLIAPGLSGWAQIHDYDAPRGGADVVRTRKKVSFDLYYLKHRSFGLDLAIAIKTLRALLSLSGT